MMLFVAVASGLVTIYLVAQFIRPLVEASVVTADDWKRVEDDSSALLARRDRLVSELRDLEFEAAMNKLDGHDLAELRAQFETEAVDVVRKLDEDAETYKARIEAEIGEKLGKAPTS